MSNANNPANPSDVTYEKDGVTVREIATGLTKREYFAGLAMCGILSHPFGRGNPEECAIAALQNADALLKELDK